MDTIYGTDCNFGPHPWGTWPLDTHLDHLIEARSLYREAGGTFGVVGSFQSHITPHLAHSRAPLNVRGAI